MAISYKYRLVVVAPQGNIVAINNEMLRIDPDGGANTIGKDLGLNPAGVGQPSHYWFSTVYRDEDIDLWKSMIGNFGAVEIWTWHMYGPDDDLVTAWAGITNVTVGEATQQEILTTLGLQKIFPT